MNDALKKTVRFVGSFDLAFILLVLLGLLVFVGTLEQQHMSLYDVQQKYFESLVLTYDVGGVPVPLLGGYLLLTIFFVNIIVGGILRMRKDWKRVGILISHVGIIVLLGGSFIEHQLSTKGQLTLFEGQTGDAYTSSNEWEFAVSELRGRGQAREFLVDADEFDSLQDGERLRLAHPELPFEATLSSFARNAQPAPATAQLPPRMREGSRVLAAIEGILLYGLQPAGAKSDRPNMPGLVVSVRPRGGAAAAQEGIVWSGEDQPFAVDIGGAQYQFELRRRTWQLPFQVRLKRFVHKLHPGTGMAKEFSSYVTKLQDGTSQDVHITMNAPMRHQGYTLYQSGWGPENAAPGTPLYSTFSVVNNPSDRVPLAACVVIAIGLLWHFGSRLKQHLKSEARRRAPAETGAQA